MCLLGDGSNMDELHELLHRIHGYGLKTCLYTGCDSIEPFRQMLPVLDYIKLGPYVAELGGLDHPDTNQRFYRVQHGELQDITYMLQGGKEHDPG